MEVLTCKSSFVFKPSSDRTIDFKLNLVSKLRNLIEFTLSSSQNQAQHMNASHTNRHAYSELPD